MRVKATPLIFTSHYTFALNSFGVCRLEQKACISRFMWQTPTLRLCYFVLSRERIVRTKRLDASASERVCVKRVRAKPPDTGDTRMPWCLYATRDPSQARAVVFTERYVSTTCLDARHGHGTVSSLTCTPNTITLAMKKDIEFIRELGLLSGYVS